MGPRPSPSPSRSRDHFSSAARPVVSDENPIKINTGDLPSPSLCPRANLEDTLHLANFATDVLYFQGRFDEALACYRVCLSREGDGRVSKEAIDEISNNFQHLVNAMYGGLERRVFVYQDKVSKSYPTKLQIAGMQPDTSIMVTDEDFDGDICDEIVRMFEAEPDKYAGNLARSGGTEVDNTAKKNTEYHITQSSKPGWQRIERQLLASMIRMLHVYGQVNPEVRDIGSPLADEGFRIKRYVADGSEFHRWHVDVGLGFASRRVLAVLWYLNDVEEGGETVFLKQGKRVSPRKGRVVVFPAGITHVHAGAAPKSNPKYAVINFITW